VSGIDDAPAFEPTVAAAEARLAAVRPGEYARTRNHLEGAVTRLSPYITHGFLSLPRVHSQVQERHGIDDRHKWVFELAWREYFHHVWRHRGEGIFASLHGGPLPDEAYVRELPADIRRGATGVPVVDRAVRMLYATGWLHNHARLWLASYVVHLRKVHWRAGADWLYGHLLDGDLASNHLSWQWVAGRGSPKPYLFNAGNVARYAPPEWHSAGTPVDASYDALDRIARSGETVPVAGDEGVDEPPLLSTPPADLALDHDPLPADAWLVHPWALREGPPERVAVGAFDAGFHAAWPWSARRWRFVHAGMAGLTTRRVWLRNPPPSEAHAFEDLHLRGRWCLANAVPVPRLFADPASCCTSFSQFWRLQAAAIASPPTPPTRARASG
jgi:deoxyribodipyrimidine photo-lyase